MTNQSNRIIIILVGLMISAAIIISAVILGNNITKATELSNEKIAQYVLAVEKNEDGVLDVYEAAEYIGIEINRFKDLLEYDEMPAHTRIGDDYFFSKESISKWLEMNRRISN